MTLCRDLHAEALQATLSEGMGGYLEPSLGERKNYRTKFRLTSREKFDLLPENLWCFFSQPLYFVYFYMWNNWWPPFFLFLPASSYFTTRNSSSRPLSVSSYFASHPITVGSQNIGGRMHGQSPIPNFGAPSPLIFHPWVKDLPKIPMWRLDLDSNCLPSGRKASTLPMRHHVKHDCRKAMAARNRMLSLLYYYIQTDGDESEIPFS